MSLLPPNASVLQRALEEPLDTIDAIPVPIRDLWDPWKIDADLLPWLAWGLSVDSWDPNWSDNTKRRTVARAIPMQRRKGNVASVKDVLASFDELLELVEWFQQTPPAAPHTFEVRLPIDGQGGVRSTAAFAEAIIRDVMRTKPVRSHFELIQSVNAVGQVGIIGAARALVSARIDGTVTADTSQPWATFLQTENGEPWQFEDGSFWEQ